MGKISLISFLCVLLTSFCLSQSVAPPANNKSGLASGTLLPVLLDKSIDAKKIHTGDPVEGKIAQDLLSNGKIVIPRDSKVLGHIAEAKPSSKEDRNSMLGITFDKIAMKDGSEIPLNVMIQAVGAPVVVNESPAVAPSPNESNPTGMNTGSPMGVPRNTAPADTTQQGGYPTTTTSGSLNQTSQGVTGMKGVSLAQGPMRDSVISSPDHNVKLESESQLLLRAK
jgi:hypothetical protein